MIFNFILNRSTCCRSFFELQLDAKIGNATAIIRHTSGKIILDLMTVKTHAQPNARFPDDSLLFFVSEKLQHIRVFPILMYAVISNVHFPKYILLRHTLEISVRIFSKRFDKGKHIGMRNAYVRTVASLGEAEQITFYYRIFNVGIFYQAVVKKRYVGIRGQSYLCEIQMRGYFDTAENADSVGILLFNKIYMIVISSHRHGFKGMRDGIGRRSERVISSKTNSVSVVGNAKQFYSTRDSRLNDSLGAVFSAKRVIRM